MKLRPNKLPTIPNELSDHAVIRNYYKTFTETELEQAKVKAEQFFSDHPNHPKIDFARRKYEVIQEILLEVNAAAVLL